MRPAFLMLLCLVSAQALAAPKKPPKTYSIPLPSKTDFSALEWLIGEWSGKTSVKGPPGEVHLSVAYDLDKRFLIIHEKVALAGSNSTPAVDESWMGVLSGRDGGKEFTLRAYSSTGFMTRYRVTAQQAEIRFVPEGGELPPPGWLFRRLVTRSGVGELVETVEAAPPDGSFFEYYSATLSRQSSSGPAAADAGDQKPK
jgi:hypothetical protein